MMENGTINMNSTAKIQIGLVEQCFEKALSYAQQAMHAYALRQLQVVADCIETCKTLCQELVKNLKALKTTLKLEDNVFKPLLSPITEFEQLALPERLSLFAEHCRKANELAKNIGKSRVLTSIWKHMVSGKHHADTMLAMALSCKKALFALAMPNHSCGQL